MLRLGVLLIILRLGASAALPSTGALSSTDTFDNSDLHGFPLCLLLCMVSLQAQACRRWLEGRAARPAAERRVWRVWRVWRPSTEPARRGGRCQQPRSCDRRTCARAGRRPSQRPRARPRALTAHRCWERCCQYPCWQPGSRADGEPCQCSRSCSSRRHEPCKRSSSSRCCWHAS